MSKEKRAADLDAELAALEAELAALEASSSKGAKKVKGAKADKPKPATEPLPAPRVPEPKKKLGLPFGKKAAEPERAQPTPGAPAIELPPAVPEHQPGPAAEPVEPAIDHDLSRWRQDGTTWVRAVDTPKRTIRRVLDENGALVREEAASGVEVERVDAVKAERGIGKLFRRKGA